MDYHGCFFPYRGVWDNWPECQQAVLGEAGAYHKKIKNIMDATAYANTGLHKPGTDLTSQWIIPIPSCNWQEDGKVGSKVGVDRFNQNGRHVKMTTGTWQ